MQAWFMAWQVRSMMRLTPDFPTNMWKASSVSMKRQVRESGSNPDCASASSCIFPSRSVKKVKRKKESQSGVSSLKAPSIRVALYSYDGSQKISEVHTDQNGMVLLFVDTPVWVAFLASVMFRIFRGDEELARSRIEANGVEGVYPGDVWVLDTRQITMEGTP